MFSLRRNKLNKLITSKAALLALAVLLLFGLAFPAGAIVSGASGTSNQTGTRIFAPDQNKFLYIVNPDFPSTPLKWLSLAGTPFDTEISPDGNKLYVSLSSTSRIDIYDLSNNTLLGSMSFLGTETSAAPKGMAISPDGKLLFVADSLLSRVHVFDLVTKTHTGDILVWTNGASGEAVPDLYDVAIRPDGAKLYVSCKRNSGATPPGAVYVYSINYNLSTGSITFGYSGKIPGLNRPTYLVVSDNISGASTTQGRLFVRVQDEVSPFADVKAYNAYTLASEGSIVLVNGDQKDPANWNEALTLSPNKNIIYLTHFNSSDLTVKVYGVNANNLSAWPGTLASVSHADSLAVDQNAKALWALYSDGYNITPIQVSGKAPGYTDNTPTAPTIISPLAGYTNVPLTSSINWNVSVDPDDTGLTYLPEYCLQSEINSGPDKWHGMERTTSTSIPLKDLTPGTGYYFRVRAYDGTDLVNFKDGNFGPYAYAGPFKMSDAPLPPINVKDVVNPGTVTLSWNSVAGATGYGVRYSTFEGFTALVNTITTTETQIDLKDLPAATKYFWQVRSVRNGNYSTWSQEIEDKDPGEEGHVPYFITSSWTGNLQDAVNSSTSATLSWNAYIGTNAGYTVQYTTIEGFTGGLNTVEVNTGTQTTISTLTPGTTYYWRMRVKFAGGATSPWYLEGDDTQNGSVGDESAQDNGVFITPAWDGNLQDAVNSSTSATLSWNSYPAANSGYAIQYTTIEGFTAGLTTIEVDSGNQTTISTLTPGTTYYWRMRIKFAGGSTSAWYKEANDTQDGSTGDESAQDNGVFITPAWVGNLQDAVNSSTSATLSWNAYTGASGYTVQYSTASNFSTNLATVEVSSGTQTTLTTLTAGTTYYWRMRVKLAGGATSAWYQEGDDTQDGSAGSEANQDNGMLITPSWEGNLQDAVNSSTSATLSWNAYTGASGYTVQYSTASNFSTNLATVEVNSGSQTTLTGLNSGTTYYWRMRIKYSGGGVSSWYKEADDTQNGSVGDESAQDNGVFITPAWDGNLQDTVNSATSATLSWNAYTGSSGYTVQYSTVQNFSSNLSTVEVNSGTQTTITTLTPGTTYYWRMRIKYSAGGVSSWYQEGEDAQQGSYDESAQDNGMFITPAWDGNLQDAVNSSTSATLSWNTYTGASGYTVQYTTIEGFTGGLSTIEVAGTQTTITTLTPGTTYYWRMRVKFAAGAPSSWYYEGDDTQNGSVGDESAQDNGMFITPAWDGNLQDAVNSSTSATLSWNTYTGASGYTVQYSTVQNFSSNLSTVEVTGVQTTISTLTPGTTYYWRMRVKFAAGAPSSWYYEGDDTQNGSVGDESAQDNGMLITPAWDSNLQDTVNSSTSATLSWNLYPTTVAGYTVQYSTALDFSANLITIEVNSGTQTTITTLTPGTTYYWRMRVKYSGGGVSSWYQEGEDTQQGSYDESAQDNGVFITPAWDNGLRDVVNSSTSATLSWNSYPTTNSGYTVQYSTDQNFTINLTTSETTATQLNLINLSTGTRYYWRMRVKFAGGVTSSWFYETVENESGESGQVGYFETTGWDANLKDVVNSSVSATLSWDSYPGSSTGYTVQYSLNSDFSTLVTVEVNSGSQTTLNNLTPGATYYWRMRVKFAGGATSAWYYETVENDSAETGQVGFFTMQTWDPNLKDVVNSETSATLSWWSYPGTFTNYTVQYSINSDFSSPVTVETTGTVANLTTLTKATTYYWRMRVNFAAGSSPWYVETTETDPGETGQVGYFTTQGEGTDLPTNLSDLVTGNNTATISWTQPTGAVGYTLQYRIGNNNFDSDPTNNIPVNLGAVTTCNLTGLIKATTYYWRLRAEFGATSSAWVYETTEGDIAEAGQVGYFITLNGLSVIIDINPNSGAQGATNIDILITGANTTFSVGFTAVTFSGQGISVNSVTVADATHVTANISIASGAPLGLRDVTVSTPGESVTATNGFSVMGPEKPIDRYEGAEVTTPTGPILRGGGGTSGGYYLFNGSTGVNKIQISLPSYDTTHMMEVRYSYNGGWGDGWGGSLTTPMDIGLLGLDAIIYRIKGDDSNNDYRLEIRTDDGSIYSGPTYQIGSSASWKTVVIPYASLNRTSGPGAITFDARPTKIVAGYQFVYTGHAQTTISHYVENIEATVRDTLGPDPTLVRAHKVSNNVVLDWTAVNDNPNPGGSGVAGYRIYRGTTYSFTPSPANLLTEVSASTFAHTDAGVVSDPNTYYYIVRAFDNQGNEAPNSNLASLMKLNVNFIPSGLNKVWISIPYLTDYKTASDIVNDMNGGPVPGAVVRISRFNSATQSFINYEYISGSWQGTNFNIVTGEGYEIKVSANVTLRIVGSHDPSFTFNLTNNGKNLISIPYSSIYATAREIVNSINGGAAPGTCIQIRRWDSAASVYENLMFNPIMGWTGNNFNFVRGEGYEILINGSTTWKPLAY